MPSIITDEYAAAVPVLQTLSPEQRMTVVTIAERVYRRVRNREENGTVPTSDAQIRAWGEQQTPPITPEAMTSALDYLTQTGQILWIADTGAPLALAPPEAEPYLPPGPPTPDPPQPQEAVAPLRKPLAEMTKTELREIARQYDIEGRSNMSERQLRNAINKLESGEDGP